MTENNPTLRERLKRGLVGGSHEPAKPANGTVGDFEPVKSVHLTEETLTWLHNTFPGEGDVYTEKVELETTEGTFKITAEDDTVIMEYTEDEE